MIGGAPIGGFPLAAALRLNVGGAAQSPSVTQLPAPERPRHQLSQTSVGSFAALLLAVALPVSNRPQAAPDRPHHAYSDTSKSTFKGLYQDSSVPFASPLLPVLDGVHRVYSDTSQQSFALTRLVQSSPVFNGPQPVLDGVHRVYSDTSQQSFALTRLIQSSPVFNGPQPVLDGVHRVYSDTSKSTFKGLYQDSAAPLFNQPWYGSDRLRPVTDSSQSAFALITPAPTPTPTPTGKNHTNLSLRQALIEYYSVEFNKAKEISAKPKVSGLKSKSVKRAEPKKVLKTVYEVEIQLANATNSEMLDMLDSVLKFNPLTKNLADFEAKLKAVKLRRQQEDDDLLLLSMII